MNHKILLMSLSIIPAVLAISLLDSISFSDSLDAQTEGITGKGVYTVTVKDSMGITKAYRQSDNAVVNNGDNCMAKMLFGRLGGDETGPDGVCEGAINSGFRYMGLDEDAQVYVTDKDLRDPADSAGLSTLTWAGITWNQNSTGGSDSLSKVTIRLSNTFTNGGADETILAVGLFNATGQDTRSMLSKANFTSVTVTSGSDLTVNYDFEVGGGTVP